jgi:hypothetical protein
MVCLSCHGTEYSKRSDFVARVTIRVAYMCHKVCNDMKEDLVFSVSYEEKLNAHYQGNIRKE